MELNDILITILDTVEMSQALSIGLFLIFLNKSKKNSLWFLGIFLIVSGLTALSDVLSVINEYVKSPYMDVLPFGFIALLPSLLYVYICEITFLKQNKNHYYILFPGLLEFVINLVVYFLPSDIRYSISESGAYILIEFSAVLFGLVVLILSFNKVRKHSKQLKDQYSSIERRELKWVFAAITWIVLFFIISPFMMISVSEFVFDIWISIFGIILVYWVSYHGLLQQTSENLIPEKPMNIQTLIEDEKGSSQVEKENGKYTGIFVKIDALLQTDELYLNPELTIIHISERIEEHPRLVSTVINKLSQQNFNSYINKYRVEKAKTLLLSEKSTQLNIEGIGFESGFKSNSSFYSAFKKFQGITPLQFLQNSEC